MVAKAVGILEEITFYLGQWCQGSRMPSSRSLQNLRLTLWYELAKDLMGNAYWGEADFLTPKYVFWDTDYFKLAIFKKQKTQERPLTFS